MTVGQLTRRVVLFDVSGNPITSTLGGSKNPLDVILYDINGDPISTFQTTLVGTNEVPTYVTVSVTTSSTAILPSPSGTRRLQAVQNMSDTVIWLQDDGSPAAVGQGQAIVPYGVYYLTVPDNVPQQGVVGIHNGTGSKVVSGWYYDAI